MIVGKLKKNIQEIFKAIKKSWRNPRKKILIIIGITAVLLLTLIYFKKELFIVASINGKPITRFSLIKELERQGGAQVLDSLITEELIFQEAKNQGIDVSEKQVEEEIEKIREQLVGQGTDLETALMLQGQSLEDLTKSLKIKFLIEQILADKVDVTDQKINEYFETNKDMYPEETSLEEVKDQIVEQLTQQELGQEYNQWITNLKENSNIKYFIEY